MHQNIHLVFRCIWHWPEEDIHIKCRFRLVYVAELRKERKFAQDAVGYGWFETLFTANRNQKRKRLLRIHNQVWNLVRYHRKWNQFLRNSAIQRQLQEPNWNQNTAFRLRKQLHAERGWRGTKYSLVHAVCKPPYARLRKHQHRDWRNVENIPPGLQLLLNMRQPGRSIQVNQTDQQQSHLGEDDADVHQEKKHYRAGGVFG